MLSLVYHVGESNTRYKWDSVLTVLVGLLRSPTSTVNTLSHLCNMRAVGIEPTTKRLKVVCSTSELRPRVLDADIVTYFRE